MKSILGIIGGMGAFATLYLFRKIVEYAPSNNDRDYLEVWIHNNSKIPDRTAALLNEGPSPLPELVRSATSLESAGADYLVMACVTAHFYYADIQRSLEKALMINILDETAGYMRSHCPAGAKVGILASTGAIRSGLWQQRIASIGCTPVVLPDTAQASLIMDAIYSDSGLKKGMVTGASRDKFMAAASLLQHMGADYLLAGCSEVPMVLSPGDLDIPVIDAINILVDSIYSRVNPKAAVCQVN